MTLREQWSVAITMGSMGVGAITVVALVLRLGLIQTMPTLASTAVAMLLAVVTIAGMTLVALAAWAILRPES